MSERQKWDNGCPRVTPDNVMRFCLKHHTCDAPYETLLLISIGVVHGADVHSTFFFVNVKTRGTICYARV